MARAARWLGLLLCCVAGTSAVSLTTASSGLVYEPDVDFHGSDEITVTVRSAAGEFASAAVPVVIEAANDAPELAGVAAARDAAAALDVVAGGGARALVLGGAPAGVRISTASGGGAWPAASAALNVSGSLDGVNARASAACAYVPPPHFDGLGVIDFVAEDAHGARDAAAAVIRVAFVDDAPTFDLGPAVDGATGAVDALEDAAVRLGGGLRSGIGADARRTPSPRVAAFSDADSTAASLVISLSADDAAVAFALVGDHPDVILDDGELRGLAGDLAVAFDDVELLPAPDWHGFARVALSVAAAEDEAAILASTSFLLRVRALQDAPAVVDGFHGAREVDEDAPLALTGVSVVDADYDDAAVAAAPSLYCTLRVSARRGSVALAGGTWAAAAAGASLVDDDAGSLTLAGRPGELTAALASLVYTSAPDGDGGDVVDFSVDDGGAFPCDDQSCEALTGALAVPIAVASVKDAPRITAPATVRYAEAFRGVALGRNGTKRETPVAGVEFEDPDSDVLAVTVVAAGGGVRTVDRVPDVDYGDDLWSERGAVVRRATLRASPERLNAALSTLAWVGDDAAGDKDGLVAGAITITATDGDGLETTATIALEASAFNDAPVLSSDLRSAEFAEDSGWAALPAVAATDFDDATLELRAAARPEGALEVHEIRTAANGGARAPAVHVISVSNASNASDPVGDGGFYVTVDLRHVPRLPPGAATRETTGLIRFDAVARIDDERRGAAGRARRETPDGSSDLSGESLESKLRALTNVRLSGLRVVAARDDYAAEDPFDAEDMRYDGAKPSPAKKGGHVWRVTMSGATPGAASAPLVASVDNSSLLAAASRVARTANAVGGTLDLAVAGFCCASVAANASGADLQRALNALPSVAAVRASRSDAEDAQGGFTWSVTFLGLAPFLEANGTARAKTVDLAARSDRLTGEGAAAAATLVTARSGAPALWRVEVGHDGDRAVHAVTLGDGAGFVRLGLDTRNCSSRAGGSGYLAAGSLRWTRPIPRAAVGDLDDESYGWTVREGRVVPAYPPHAGHELGGPNSSVEAQLLRLPNWRDMGPARLDVTRHEHESSNRVTWRVTFSDAPHALPLLRVKAVEGNDDEDYDDLSLSDADAAREEAWAAANTTQTKVASLGNRANVRSRVAQGGRASTALELEAPPLGGTFRLGWGDDGQWTAPLTVGASEDDVAAALGALPAFLRPGAGRGAEFVVARDGPLAGGGYAYWTDAAALRGPRTRRARARLWRPAHDAGVLRLGVARAPLAVLSGDYRGDVAVSASGSPASLTAALAGLAFRPLGDYFGVVAVDLAVADAAGATDHLGLTVTVAGANDGPHFDWYGAAVDVSGAGYGTYALDVDEDAEGRLLGLALRDADANPGEVHAVTLKAKHGILAVHRAPADPDAVARRDDATTWHEDAGVPGVAKEPLPANRTAPAAGRSSRDDENNELVLTGSLAAINDALATLTYVSLRDFNGVDAVTLDAVDGSGARATPRSLAVRVRPVNDFPVWAVDAEARNFALAPEMGAADVAGRGVARLYGYHASTASAHDASAYFNANNYSGNGSLVVAARFVDEDCGFVRVGGLSVDDADAYSPTLDSLPGVDFGGWPAHLEVRATVGFGKLNLRAGTGAGAAAVLKAAGASDLQVVDGDAVAGSRTLVVRGRIAGVRAALGALAYAPDAHWNGVDVLELTASDGGDAAYGAGGPRSAAVLIALEVAPVADAPQVVVPAALETFGVDALEDEVLQFGGPAAQASQNRVAGAFAVVDDDLVDLRSTARRWLVPYSRSADTLDVRTPRLGDLDGGEANREDASSTKGTYAYANSHEQAAAGLAVAHVDAGDVESDRHGYRVHRVRDRYTLVVAARRGFVALPTAHAPEDADWKKEHTLVNYTLAEANRALVGLQYVPDFNWNSAAQARKAADVAGFDGRVDGDGPLETITVAAYDATGRSGSSTYEFYVKPVNDAPVLASVRSGARDPYAGEADQATRLTFRADTLVVAEDGSSSDLGATVRDVDALDVVGGLIDVVAVATRGVLRLDDAARAAGGRGRVRLSAGAEGSRLLGFSGEPDAVAAALGALNYAPDADFAGDDAVLVTASDRGNSGAGGDGSDALELPVEVRPTCDAPVVAPRSRAYATAEDAAATVGFDIFDEDHANLLRAYEAGLDVSGAPVNATSDATFFPLVSATLTAGNGSLTIEEGARRALRFVRGTSGVSESLIAFRATIADAAAAVAAVSYAPRRDYFSAPVRAGVPALDRVELVLEDLGLDFGGLPDGFGGVDCAPLVGSAHAKVRVDAVNDGPVVKVPGAVYEASDLAGSTFRDGAVRGDLVLKRIKPMAVPEDTILELGSLVSVADDADDADAFPDAVGALTVSVSNGEFALGVLGAGAAVATDPRDGPVDDVDDGVDDEDDDRFRAGSRWRRAAVRWRVRPGDRDAALRGLRFRGLPDAHGNASLTVAWEDGGHGGLGNARGVAGCRDCSPAFRGSAEDLAPSLHDAKTIPVVVAPVPDAPYVDSAYGGGASVEVPEDGDVWLRGVRVVDPDDADAPFTLRLAADRGSVSLGFPPPSSLRFEVGDGDMDRAVRCRGPLSAINAVLADLRYAPPRDFTTAGAGALDVLSLVVHDVDDFDRSASSTIRLRVAPSSNWNDAPALRIPNASRVGSPCVARPEGALRRTRGRTEDPGRDADEVPVCDRRVAVASMAGFVEDVVRHPFGGITFSDADEAEILYTAPRLEVRLAVTNGLLKFDGADGLGLQALDEAAPLGVFRSRQAFRGAPDLLTAAMRSLAYVTKENWYGVDALNISVVDGKGHDDAATIILDVDRAPDRPFLEARADEAAPLYRYGGFGGPTGAWGPAAALEDAPLLTSEDVRFRLPTLRVRDVDAEANADAVAAAGRAGETAADAIRELVRGREVPNALEGPKVEVEARLTLRVSVHFGKVSLCALKCPGVSFLEPDYAFEARRRGGVAALAGVRAPPFEPYAVLEAGARTGDGTVRTGRPQLRWWRNATLRGTAAALTRALWDAHYWPDLNYNSDAAGREDDVLTVRLSEEPPSGDGSPSDEAVLRVQVAAANDAPVVAAARLETLARPLSSTGEAPTTGDGLSLAVVAVDDDALVTTEDEPLVLAELFSVRDADAAEAGGDATALEVTVDATRGAAAFALDAPDVLFLEPADWGAWNDTAAAAYETRQPWRDVGARRVVFLAGPDAANAALAALAFIPARDWHGSGATVTVTCDDRGNFGAGGAARAARTVKIRVREANDPPTLAAPELGGADALYLDAGGRGRLAGASAVDAKLGHVAAFAPRDRFGALRRMEAGLEPHAPYASPDEAAHAGSELWRSAPARGTRDVVDDAYYAGAGSDPAHGWRSANVGDLAARGSSRPRFFSELDDRLYFAADGDGGRGAELWASDGTGSHLVADVLPGAGSSDPRFVTTYGDLLYFSARGNDARNWRVPLDHVDDCGSARQSSFEPRAHFVVAEHNVWEPGWTYDCPQGFRWMTSAEGDAAFTGANFGPSTGAGWVTGDDTSEPLVYYDQCGWEGYRWGGKAREHFRFSDSHITGSYKSAGSPDGRRPDLDRKRRGKVDLRVNKFAGIMCIEDGAYAGVSPTGAELWVSDGRTETYRAAEIRPGGPESHSDPRYLAVFDGALFMSADDGFHGRELFRFVADDDAGRGSARMVGDLRRGPEPSHPRYLTACGGFLWFAADDGFSGDELWVSDGKLGFLDRDRGDAAHPSSFPEVGGAGTRVAADVFAGRPGSQPDHLACLDGTLLFAASTKHEGRELWRATWKYRNDTATLDVALVKDIRPGTKPSNPSSIFAFNGRAYFAADDGVVGAELWVTDGSGANTRLLEDLRPGARGSSPKYFTALTTEASRLFFLATTSDLGDARGSSLEAPVARRLFESDGTRHGTKRVYDQTEALFDVDDEVLDAAWPRTLAPLGAALYYPARRGSTKLRGGAAAGRATSGAPRRLRTLAFAVYDVDVGESLHMTLTVDPPEAGGLTLGDLRGCTLLDGDGVRDAKLDLRGSRDELNGAMEDLSFEARDGFHGRAIVFASVKDDAPRCPAANATDGTRGPNATADDCVRGFNATAYGNATVFVRKRNLPPSIVVARGPVGAAPDATPTLIRKAAVVDDPDATETNFGVDPTTGLRVAPRLVVTVASARGRVSLAATDAALSFLEGEGTQDRRTVFDGALPDLNRALATLAYECWSLDGCAAGEADAINVTVDDGGFSGYGGALTASGSIPVVLVGY
ncbi:hypothetical protein SO694_00016060 [Aureococcus anophagefferens]|uniref:Cadherin domain-containing protein n=1 Tax=Aureococcus anophagefferens TaxID=44056 RepID=A0ABR1G1S6_AURAN